MPGAPEAVGRGGHAVCGSPVVLNLLAQVLLPAGTVAEWPVPSEEAAREQEKGRTVLLYQVDLKAPEDQPKNLLFKPHIYVRSNAAGGHALASASGLGLQLGPIF